MISIPIKFQLGGRTWTVEIVDTIDNDPETLGQTDSDSAVIQLKSGMKPELFQHTFYHELCHALCFTLGWKKLNKNEDDIDALASVLLQYLKSKRGTTTPE